MPQIELPSPAVRVNPQNPVLLDAALQAGYSRPIAQALAGRSLPDDRPLEEILHPSLKALDPPSTLADIGVAAERLYQAILAREYIVCCVDHDSDGINSACILYKGLTEQLGHPSDRVEIISGHRLKEGYGISEGVVSRILALPTRPSLVISADCGSSDEPRIARLAKAGIDTIVTDHHELPEEGPPASAVACVNPQRTDCQYPDPLVAGCFMSWLLLAATRQTLIDAGLIGANEARLAPLLAWAAIGTVADCVSLARSTNNRAIVAYGIKQIENSDEPVWKALRKSLSDPDKPLSAEDLAFRWGPAINASGRLDDAMAGIKTLLSTSEQEAAQWAEFLKSENEERKQIEREMTQRALDQAAKLVDQGYWTLSLFDPDGHPGIHGITASRITEKFGRPCAFFSPTATDPNILTGSLRGVDADGLHIRKALQHVHDKSPGILDRFGGHAMAAGCKLMPGHDSYESFRDAFEWAVREQIQSSDLGPVIWTDGDIDPHVLTLALVDETQNLGPWGREFESPTFQMEAELEQIRMVGTPKVHMQLTLRSGNRQFKGIWFFAIQEEGLQEPVTPGKNYRFVFSADKNSFKGKTSLQLLVRYAVPV